MTSYHKLILVGALLLVLAAVLACDTGNLIAFQSATATPTRTPRPTFTPPPSLTPTPEEDTPTPLPTVTETPKVKPSATRSSQVVAKQPTKAPTKPPAPPPPSFPIRLDEGYACPQPQDPIWKFTGRIQRESDKGWVEGYSLGVFTRDGRFLKASEPSAPEPSLTLNGNCKAYNRYYSNAEVDVAEFRMQVPLVVRVIRSKTDHTALSPDFVADFAEPAHYYVHYFVK